ncbi:uncharacterized protein LOC110858191 isoform X2 [Folsomia candida]|uniref:uncharacterized protein LOC110858191 isoform X2 n=1 Tax=Folsomia candida TaxID=158441 RepID=UPI00160510F2|nr:uncharacterized protein LOC110858191 isoform X2 [Folsomia candida]
MMGDVESSTTRDQDDQGNSGRSGSGSGGGSPEDNSSTDSSSVGGGASGDLQRQGTVIQRSKKMGDEIPASSSSPPPPPQIVNNSNHNHDEDGGTGGGGGGEEDESSLADSRIVPFRSASFSQVDTTLEGNYFTLPARSPNNITLKPSAFCLLPPAPATLPRTTKPTTTATTTPQNRVQFQVGDPTYVDPAVEELNVTRPQQVESPDEKTMDMTTTTPTSDNDPDEEKGHVRGGTTPAKAKIAFKMGHLNPKLTPLDLSGGAGGPADEEIIDSTAQQQQDLLVRQSSGQSDGSEGGLSDPCASPPVPITADSAPYTTTTTTTTGATTTTSSAATTTTTSPRTALLFRSSGGLSSPPPMGPSFYNYRYNYPRSTTSPPPPSSDSTCSSPVSRTNSIGSSSTPSPRRYYKRPLRGPYGEMLEAEMNRVSASSMRNKSLARDLDGGLSDFCRESRSSSPPPNVTSTATPSSADHHHHHHPTDGNLLLIGTSPKLGNSLHELRTSWASSSSSSPSSSSGIVSNAPNKHNTNPRTRKVSAMSSMTTTGSSVETVGGVLHQRTASSPSQLLSSPPPPRPSRPLDSSPRGHVLAELVETERSYVESLGNLVNNYMTPLKLVDYIEASLVDEIFFQIPDILKHHKRYLAELERRVTDDTQSVGDVLLDMFRDTSLLDCYSLFVNNWKNAKGSLKMAVASKPPLGRFLEAKARSHRGKLSIDSLLIMPIQRIPRYELLVKELLKHTDPTHDDHSRLILVLEKIKKFAVHIDCASVDSSDNRDLEIEGWTSGLGHLVSVTLVTLLTPSNVRKERALFLFADSILLASIKRKSSTMRKTSSNQFFQSQGSSSQGGQGSIISGPGGSLDGCKFKLLLKLGLLDVQQRTNSDQGGNSDEFHHHHHHHFQDIEDMKTLQKMMDLATLLRCPHAPLDDLLTSMSAGLNRSYTYNGDNNGGDVVELEVREVSGGSGGGGNSGDASPEVLKIMFGSCERKSAWLESFADTVAKFIRYGFGRLPHMNFVGALPIRKTRAGLQLSCAAPVWLWLHSREQRVDVWVANSDGYVGQICILTLHPEPAITSCNGVCNSRITCILAVPPLGYDANTPPNFHDSSEDDGVAGYSGRSRGRSSSSEHWSVWLGTEDSNLQIYDCSDSVRVKKSKHKVPLKAALLCMAYYDSRVFVSLGNGEVAIYSRNARRGWIVEPNWMTIGSVMSPVTKMTTTSTCLWCVTSSQVKLYSSSGDCGMLELVQTLPISGVVTLAATEEMVWIATASSVIRCYSTPNFELISHVDVGPEVAKILSGCDDIIRQHKSACLRVTALLVAPDNTLWIGTSAGVILTLASGSSSSSPPISPGAGGGGGGSGSPRRCTPLPHGHTGQVRFLTSCTSRDSTTVVISGGDGFEEFRPPGYPILCSTGTMSGGTLVGSSGGGGGNVMSSTTGSGGLSREGSYSMSSSSMSSASSSSTAGGSGSGGGGGGGGVGLTSSNSLDNSTTTTSTNTAITPTTAATTPTAGGSSGGGNSSGANSDTKSSAGGGGSSSVGDLSGREDSTNHLLIWKTPSKPSTTTSTGSSSS